MKSALLLSGGMDSLGVAWWKKPDIGITVNYGQLAAEAEVSASQKICQELNIEHHVINIDCCSLGSGDMAGSIENKYAPASDWWPYRNQMLITFAAMKAITLGTTEIWLGTVKTDDAHSDGSVEFIQSVNQLVSMQEGGIQIKAPAIHMTTTELINIAKVPKHFLSWAHSCHKANIACGNCRGCNKYFEVWSDVYERLD